MISDRLKGGYNLNGLVNSNVELTSRCNKHCWMCGRRNIERVYPELVKQYGDMDFRLVKTISVQLPPNIVVQLHNNGEPTLYPRLGEAIKLFDKQITHFDTNGKLIVDKAKEIIGNLDTMAVSVIENDPESEEQYESIKKFLELKGERKPYVIFRLNGNVDSTRYEGLGGIIARRVIHAEMGSYNYRVEPTKPEIGICLDFLNHLSIDKDGDVSICVRFDPKRLGVLGNIKHQTIEEMWYSEKRMEWLEYHKRGKRDKIPLCSYCDFWGVPTSGSCEAKRNR
jgi:radical SAM protein with 4Fe4S-binding SPASM domain